MTDTGMRCPWCSALVPEPVPGNCPSCQAKLAAAGVSDPALPGVTQLDTAALLRAAQQPTKPRGRLLAFLTGEGPEPISPLRNPASLAPPDDAVRREMLRLQFEADRAQAQAEVLALKSEVLRERGIHLSQLGAADADADTDSNAAGEPPAG